jgi:hypothetical protein
MSILPIMSQSNLVSLNIKQNQEDFELEPFSNQSPCFKYKLLKKTLDLPKENPHDKNNFRNIIVKYLYTGCK